MIFPGKGRVGRPPVAGVTDGRLERLCVTISDGMVAWLRRKGGGNASLAVRSLVADAMRGSKTQVGRGRQRKGIERPLDAGDDERNIPR